MNPSPLGHQKIIVLCHDAERGDLHVACGSMVLANPRAFSVGSERDDYFRVALPGMNVQRLVIVHLARLFPFSDGRNFGKSWENGLSDIFETPRHTGGLQEFALGATLTLEK
jgi:hypothetical protein